MREHNSTMSFQRLATRGSDRRGAFTLLEILLVLALMAVLLVGLSSIVRLFSRHYEANERRVGRAQLARSISQMLSDDLGAAIQDPIAAVDNDPSRQYVRHFGLRGDSRSLQIDVVQPSSFTPVADADENRRVMAGGDKKVNSRQAPELKTIFYEFVPINDTQKLPGETTDESSSASSATGAAGADLGSTLGGSLAGNVDAATLGLSASELDSANLFWDGMRPLEQKFGLSRRELDYETPEEDDGDDPSANPADALAGDETNVSQLAGSLTTTPDLTASTLTGSSASSAALSGTTSTLDPSAQFKAPMTAAQIAMDSDDGTTWAPEVLDCRFRYFDGETWFDSWDSLEKNGLPVAIKVELKLAPLDDVDYYRASPLLLSLPKAPSVDELGKLARQSEEEQTDDGVNSSRLAGALTGTPGSAQGDAQPVDVFNSYRTPTSIVAALTGAPRTSKTATPYSQISQSNALSSTSDQTSLQDLASDLTLDDMTGSSETAASSGLGGGLDMGLGDLAGSGVGGSLSGDAGQSSVAAQGGSSTGDAFLDQAQELAAGGAVYNEAGVCVDFSNDGSYTTLEAIAKEIGVSEPTFYEVIAYLPTTPFSRAKTIERRQPTTARRGMVATGNRAGNTGAGGRQGRGANPYATGTARAPRERQAASRTANERTNRDRQAAGRTAANRGAAERGGPAERAGRDRQANGREQRERGGNERVASNRQARERFGLNGGTGTGGLVSDDSGTPIGADITGIVPDVTGADRAGASAFPDMTGGAAAGANASQAGVGGSIGGGLAGTGGATNLGAFDPFAIVDPATTTETPYADSAFSDVVSQFDGSVTPGLIADPNGTNTVQTPNPTTARAPQGQKQTWIRGGKK